jgi:hypothetical protein
MRRKLNANPVARTDPDKILNRGPGSMRQNLLAIL